MNNQLTLDRFTITKNWKNLMVILAMIPLLVFAREVTRTVTGGFDGSNAIGANTFIVSIINREISSWNRGDKVHLNQNGRKYTYTYHPLTGRFVGPSIPGGTPNRDEKDEHQQTK